MTKDGILEGDGDGGHGEGVIVVVERGEAEGRRGQPQPQHHLVGSAFGNGGGLGGGVGVVQDQKRAVCDDEDGPHRGDGQGRGNSGKPPRCPSRSRSPSPRAPPPLRYQQHQSQQRRRSPTTRRRRRRSRRTTLESSGKSVVDAGDERSPLIGVVGRSIPSSSSSSSSSSLTTPSSSASVKMGDDGRRGSRGIGGSGGGTHKDDELRSPPNRKQHQHQHEHHRVSENHANDGVVCANVGGGGGRELSRRRSRHSSRRSSGSGRHRRDGYSPIGEERQDRSHHDHDHDHEKSHDHDLAYRRRSLELLPLLPVAPPGCGGAGGIHANEVSSSSASVTVCIFLAWFSLGGAIFLVFVLILIERQPFFVKGFSSLDDDELRKAATNTSLGAMSYGASLLVSLCCLRHHDRIEGWWQRFALKVRSWWQRRLIHRRRWARRWSTTTAAEDGGVWMYSYHAAGSSVGRDGIGSDTGASIGAGSWLGEDDEMPLRRRSMYQNPGAGASGSGAQYGTFELWKLRWSGVAVGGTSGGDGSSYDGHKKTKRR